MFKTFARLPDFRPAPEHAVVSIAGKTFCGTLRPPAKTLHCGTVWSHASGLVCQTIRERAGHEWTWVKDNPPKLQKEVCPPACSVCVDSPGFSPRPHTAS